MSRQVKKGFLVAAISLLVGIGAYALIFGTKGTPSSVGARVEAERGTSKGLQAEKGVAGDEVRGTAEASGVGSQSESNDRPQILKEALAALEDEYADPETLIKAILSLRRVPSREAVELLSKFLALEDEAVLAEAIDTLGSIGLNSEHKNFVLSLLLEKAKDKDFLSRGPALLTAAIIGEPGRTLPVIAQAIAEEGDSGKDFAVRALNLIATPECLPLVRDLLEKTNDWEILKMAYGLLAKINTPEAFQLLRDGLYSMDNDRQYQSAWALSRTLNEEYTTSLIEAVSSGDLKSDAMRIVARSPAAPGVFGTVLSDNRIDKNYRLQLFDVLASNVGNAPGPVRNSVAEMLHPFVNSSDPGVEVAALKAIAKVGASTDQTSVIAPKLESGDFLVQGAALEAFQPYCTPKTYTLLKPLWYDGDEKIRRTAFLFSTGFLNVSDIPDLEKATTHSDEFIKKHAGLMIKYLTPKKGTH